MDQPGLVAEIPREPGITEHMIERGFCFLKSPDFPESSLYLKQLDAQMKIQSLNKAAFFFLLILCLTGTQTTNALFYKPSGHSRGAFNLILNNQLLVKPEFVTSWSTLVATLQGVSGFLFGADAAIYFYDLATLRNNTQPSGLTPILHKVLPTAGLIILSFSEFILSAQNFQKYRSGMELIPGSKTYHFITAGGASLGLLLIGIGIATEETTTTRAGSFIAFTSYGLTTVTTNWRKVEGMLFHVFEAIAGTIGGILFIAASFAPSEDTGVVETLFATALTLFCSTQVLGSALFYYQLMRSKLAQQKTNAIP